MYIHCKKIGNPWVLGQPKFEKQIETEPEDCCKAY